MRPDYDTTVRRRAADTVDVCARPGCGVSMKGRALQAKFCSDRCKDLKYEAAQPVVESATFTTGSRSCKAHSHVFDFGAVTCRCGAFEVNESVRGMRKVGA